MKHDWESDDRPFKEVIRAWTKVHGWTRSQASAELRVPLDTFHNWAAGTRTPSPELMVRRLMALIDRDISRG